MFCAGSLFSQTAGQKVKVKKARKFVLRKTNLRALRDFGIILYPKSDGINLVSTSDFADFFKL